jgi:hypothetical protein
VDVQDAVLELRLRLRRVNFDGQSKTTLELAIFTLDLVEPLAVALPPPGDARPVP